MSKLTQQIICRCPGGTQEIWASNTCRADFPGLLSFSPHFGVLSVLFLFLDLSATNPNIPPPRQRQFGFKGNHGRNRACREQLETLEARRLAEGAACKCVCFPYSCAALLNRSPLSAPAHRNTPHCAPQKAPFPTMLGSNGLAVTGSSYKRVCCIPSAASAPSSPPPRAWIRGDLSPRVTMSRSERRCPQHGSPSPG